MKRALLRSELLLVVVVMLVLGTGGRGGDAARPTHSSQRAVMPAHRPQPTIVFSSARDGQKRHYDIYVAIQHASRVRQFEIRRLTDHPRGASWPSWSPDGNRIAFMSKRHDPGEDIYTMKVDGTNVVRLTNTPALDWYPRWSPNGNYIAWARCSGSGFNVWVMDADGSNPHALTHLATTDDQPDWAPSSTRVVFRSKRDGTYEIYRMKTDGTELMRLTNNPAEDSNPAWSPDSQRIATLAGAVSSAAALTSAASALIIGRLGDRFGTKRQPIRGGHDEQGLSYLRGGKGGKQFLPGPAQQGRPVLRV